MARNYLGALKSVSLTDNIINAALSLEDLDPLVRAVGSSSFVLIGEASHGTHEFYYYRAELTKRLILEKGFQHIAVEADWPDAYRINKYVRGLGNDKTAEEALSDFKRFPKWLWRNQVVVEFIEWLKEHNAKLDQSKKVGFYGLDLYSMQTSRQAVIDYLETIDSDAADRARKRYSCFDQFGKDPQSYGKKVCSGKSKGCKAEAVKQLVEMTNNAKHYKIEMSGDDPLWPIQNAAVVKGAEDYYRAMFSSGTKSWNIRDEHMTDTLQMISKHFRGAKMIVWEHNSHIGDARETDRTQRGKVNVGQLSRERFGIENTFIIGFTTYTGTVTAAHEWGYPVELMKVNPGMSGSFEERFHETGLPQFMLLFRGNSVPELQQKLAKEMKNIELLERAIGVIYRPNTERESHYGTARLARQFDAVIHVDTTRALIPLDNNHPWLEAEEAKIILRQAL